MSWADEANAKYLKPWREEAQAAIDSLGLSTQVCCDECTGVTIEGYYDTAFD